MANFEVDTDAEPGTDTDNSKTFGPVYNLRIGTEFCQLL
ncbi:hypothetical protein D3OALGA1CA_841 [Olavius algarvensis associated proteobacterium Delta 3]|nr:hypothetical protein D3OALGA1CA_841 [Olavius algarvensis associated proteobacterium Delta 3]CAB5142974.1 hypothetical protein D3OALGB2SA_4345 [Olavius algarvensis associated proteobacterium Delta 3]